MYIARRDCPYLLSTRAHEKSIPQSIDRVFPHNLTQLFFLFSILLVIQRPLTYFHTTNEKIIVIIIKTAIVSVELSSQNKHSMGIHMYSKPNRLSRLDITNYTPAFDRVPTN